MKPKHASRLVFPALILAGSLAAPLAQAASQTWDGGGGDANWSTVGNWNGDTAAPGDTVSTSNTDVATFNAAIVNTWGDAVGNPIVIDSATQNIGGISFDTSAGSYFIGSTGGNALLLSSGGSIQILATLTATNAIETINAPLVIQDAGGTYVFANDSVNGAGAGAGTLNVGGDITGDAAGDTILTLSGSNTNANTISGIIGNGSATSLTITKDGAGTWNLSGANTYTGATTVSAGTLQAGSSTAFNDTSALTMTDTAILDLNSFNAAFTGATLSTATATITNNAAGTGTSTIIVNNAGAIDALVTDGATAKVAVTLNNSNGITWMTNANNTFSGGLLLSHNASGGTRMVVNTMAATTGSPGAITSGPYGTGTITIGQAATDKAGIYFQTATTLVNALTMNTALGTDRPGLRADNGSIVVMSGMVTADQAPATFSTNDAGSFALTGQVTGPSGITLDNTYGTGITVTLNNASASPNNYQGTTNIAGINGFLVLASANQIPNGAGTGNVVNNGTLSMGGFSDTINGLSGSGTVDGVSGSPSLTVGDDNATDQTFTGVIKNTTGSLSLTKIGTGTQVLGGANTYSGATTISAGTLKLQPSSAAPSTPVAGYARWFDASTIAGADGASISTWTNGGAGGDATVPSGNSAPTKVSNAGTETGLSALHFTGPADSANTSQALTFTRDTSIRSIFSIFKGASFLLTDSTNYDLHRPGDSNAADPLLASYGQINYLGSVYVNGALVPSPTSSAMPTTLHGGFNLVSVITNGNPVEANGFNKDRTYHSGDQSQAEVIIYDTVLSNTQRLAVEAYLNAKWFGITPSGGLLPSASPVTIASSATFDLNGVTQQIASLTGSGGASVTNSGITDSILTISGAFNTNFGGAISNGATNKISLVKSGAGIQTLSGTNTYSGNTTVNAGTLKLTSANTNNQSSTVTTATTGAALELAFVGTDTVNKLFIGATQMAPGVYKSSTNLGAGIAIAQIIGTGTLTVTSGASSNFASWANDPSKGNIPGEPPTGDFENDGLTNLIEYALGKNPRVSSQPAGVLSGNVITFTKGADAIANGDVSWVIETSTTLAAGSWTTQVTQAAGNPAATISYTFTPSTPVANFARLKVTQN